VSMPVEVVAFMGGIEDALALFAGIYKTQSTWCICVFKPTLYVLDPLLLYSASPRGLQEEFSYWDRANAAREAYRLATRVHFDGQMVDVQVTPEPLMIRLRPTLLWCMYLNPSSLVEVPMIILLYD
jgi:hypothetical protein